MVTKSDNKQAEIPTSDQADKWLTEDIFIVDGKLYYISPNGIVSSVDDKQ